MENYHCSVLIGAPVSTLYEALTTRRGISGWWTTSCEVGTEVGDEIRIHFGRTFKVMRIEALEKDAMVRWLVTDALLDVPGLTKTSEWIGTTILFRLEAESPRETRLRLEHIGLTPEVECHEICSRGWEQFLVSLKNHAESGTGTPFAGDHG